MNEESLSISNKATRPSLFKRLLALIVDTIIISLIGFATSFLFEDFYVSLGNLGPLVGLIFVVLYFSIFQSEIGKGQSIGKRAIEAKVTDIYGNLLTFKQAFLRATILFIPFYLDSVFLISEVGFYFSLLLNLAGLAIIYFMLINISRRGLHDILMKTTVVNADISEITIDEENDKSKKKTIGITVLTGVLVVTSVFFNSFYNGFTDLREARTEIEKIEEVSYVNGLSITNSTRIINDESPFNLSLILVSVKVNDESYLDFEEYSNDLSDQIYSVVQQEVPEANDVDEVNVTLTYGYDIGIWNHKRTTTKTYER